MNRLQPYVATWERGLYQTLTRHSIVYQIGDKARGSQVFTFRLRLADSADLKKALSLSEQLALTMSVSSVRVARHLGLVDVEIALPKSFHKALPVNTLRRKGNTWISLGQTATGAPVHVNLAGNRTCHTLVSGQTESGKTLTQQLIAWTLATDNDPQTVNLLLIDSKGGASWWGFERAASLAHPIIVVDANAAYIATGVKNSGAESLQGNGDFLLAVAGQVHRLQIAIIGNRELGRLPRAETTPHLDFGDYDPVRVLDVTSKPKAYDLAPDHLAVALATNKGINWLQNALGIGGRKATRVRRFAQAMRAKLDEMGYSVIPSFQDSMTDPLAV